MGLADFFIIKKIIAVCIRSLFVKFFNAISREYNFFQMLLGNLTYHNFFFPFT